MTQLWELVTIESILYIFLLFKIKQVLFQVNSEEDLVFIFLSKYKVRLKTLKLYSSSNSSLHSVISSPLYANWSVKMGIELSY